MHAKEPQNRKGIKRRDVFKAGGAAAVSLSIPAGAQAVTPSGADVYTRLGVRPFINTTATLTINGGSRTMPEVIAAIEQASQFHVNLDELMEKAGAGSLNS